jgi:radical SAM protein with 4Fe4S-binding SPASM domain
MAALRARNRQRLADDYRDRQVVVRGRPVHLKIELTNFCNLACPMCPHQQMRRPVGYMRPELFRRIIDQAAPELEFAYVHHLGESLFHPRIGELIAYGRQRGIAMGLSTNATFLSARKTRALLDSGLDFLVVSLDANSEQSYAHMRRGGDFRRTVANVRHLFAEKKARQSATQVVVQMIVSAHNQHEVASFAHTWDGQIVLKVARDWAGQVPLAALLRPPATGAAAEPTSEQPCRMLWTELTVLWDGQVVPCANVYEHENLLGDLEKKSLDEIWNGAPLLALRRAHLDDAVAAVPVCRTCPRHPLDRKDFIAVDQLTQRLRNYIGTDLTPRRGLS